MIWTEPEMAQLSSFSASGIKQTQKKRSHQMKNLFLGRNQLMTSPIISANVRMRQKIKFRVTEVAHRKYIRVHLCLTEINILPFRSLWCTVPNCSEFHRIPKSVRHSFPRQEKKNRSTWKWPVQKMLRSKIWTSNISSFWESSCLSFQTKCWHLSKSRKNCNLANSFASCNNMQCSGFFHNWKWANTELQKQKPEMFLFALLASPSFGRRPANQDSSQSLKLCKTWSKRNTWFSLLLFQWNHPMC